MLGMMVYIAVIMIKPEGQVQVDEHLTSAQVYFSTEGV